MEERTENEIFEVIFYIAEGIILIICGMMMFHGNYKFAVVVALIVTTVAMFYILTR